MIPHIDKEMAAVLIKYHPDTKSICVPDSEVRNRLISERLIEITVRLKDHYAITKLGEQAIEQYIDIKNENLKAKQS